jgi:hypothetical protein
MLVQRIFRTPAGEEKATFVRIDLPEDPNNPPYRRIPDDLPKELPAYLKAVLYNVALNLNQAADRGQTFWARLHIKGQNGEKCYLESLTEKPTVLAVWTD